jgi:predicted ester cyclase
MKAGQNIFSQGDIMSEKNKALVRDILERGWNGDLSGFEDNPGLQELLPTIRAVMTMDADSTNTLHELLADGDWVIARFTSEMTLRSAAMGMEAGAHMVFETIAMYKVENGVVVKQHSQGGRSDVPYTVG